LLTKEKHLRSSPQILLPRWSSV